MTIDIQKLRSTAIQPISPLRSYMTEFARLAGIGLVVYILAKYAAIMAGG